VAHPKEAAARWLSDEMSGQNAFDPRWCCFFAAAHIKGMPGFHKPPVHAGWVLLRGMGDGLARKANQGLRRRAAKFQISPTLGGAAVHGCACQHDATLLASVFLSCLGLHF
jgi:hypothetical protein